MRASRVLRAARERAGLTQRELAARCGVAQPSIARIESGDVVPRVDTLERLLAGCGEALDTHRLGEGVDRTQIRELLRLTPEERLDGVVEEARNLRLFLEAVREP